MGHAKPSADQHVVARHPPLLGNSDEAQAIGKNVDVVARRQSHGDLELPGKISLSVNRFHDLFSHGNFFLIQPNFGIGGSTGRQVIVNLLGQGKRLRMQTGLEGIRRAHDVAVDVSAGRQGIQQSIVDLLHGLLEVPLENPMQLEGLAGRELEGAVGELVGELIDSEPLSPGADASRHSDPDHKGKSFFLSFLEQFLPLVAIVLQVGAVELGQLGVVGGDRPS